MDRKLVKKLRAADDVCKLLTGKKLSAVIARGIEVFGDEVIKKAAEPETIDFNDPYYILSIHKDAPDFIVKAAFRALCKELHPDTGTKPDPARFQRVTEAYQKIIQTRKNSQEVKHGNSAGQT